GGEVPARGPAQLVHRRVVGRALDAAVPRIVVVVAVAVVLAVALVVLAVVAHEVTQREAVVAGDEVDAVPGRAAILSVEVGGACEPPAEVGQLTRISPRVSSHRVTEATVPLAPI